MSARLEALLARHWWRPRPSWLASALLPLSWVYGWLRATVEARHPDAETAPVPVLVVGNLIAGGAGKTPTVVAMVQALQAAGHRPGIVSRGHGRRDDSVRAVLPGDAPADVGDEPLLLARRTGVPVWVGRDRVAAAQALCRQHPSVDVLVSDDGLQHHRLARQAELVVFDERGAGNGLLLPAGPLREPMPGALSSQTGIRRVLYTAGHASTPLPGALAQRHITHAWPLAAWHAGDTSARQPLSALCDRPLLAAAGLAAPDKFFSMLQAAGLTFTRLPLPDHHPYTTLPWPAETADVVTTEKDAVKLLPNPSQPSHLPGPPRHTRVWVVPLDLELPTALVRELLQLLFPAPPAPSSERQSSNHSSRARHEP